MNVQGDPCWRTSSYPRALKRAAFAWFTVTAAKPCRAVAAADVRFVRQEPQGEPGTRCSSVAVLEQESDTLGCTAMCRWAERKRCAHCSKASRPGWYPYRGVGRPGRLRRIGSATRAGRVTAIRRAPRRSAAHAGAARSTPALWCGRRRGCTLARETQECKRPARVLSSRQREACHRGPDPGPRRCGLARRGRRAG